MISLLVYRNWPPSGRNLFPPFSAIRKALIMSKGYKIDDVCQQNTNRKTMVALLTGDVTSGLKRLLALEIDIPP
jgi:hypothetical protein